MAVCVWMCDAEYGGGERRTFSENALTGSLPVGLGSLPVLEFLCVWPAPPPHAPWGAAATREEGGLFGCLGVLLNCA